MIKFLFLILFPAFTFSQKQLEGNSITNKISGGVRPYRYSMDNITYQSDSTFNCLSPSIYTFYIKDARDSMVIQTVQLYPSLYLVAGAITNSSITVTASGGKSPYTYSKNGTTWQSSNIFSRLSRRTNYTIRVKDSLGYTYSITSTTL